MSIVVKKNVVSVLPEITQLLFAFAIAVSLFAIAKLIKKTDVEKGCQYLFQRFSGKNRSMV